VGILRTVRYACADKCRSLATNRQYSQQQALHRDVLEIRDNHGDKLDEVLEGISQIREDIQRRSSHHAQSNTAYSNSHVRATGDKAEGLSAQLQEILIVAKASIGETAIHTPLSGMSSASQGSFLDSSSVSSLAETQSIMSKKMPPDSLPDVTHVEPLRELASRLQEQAASDFEHGHFKFAEYHQLESIKCHEELHDVHGIAFKSYHSMKMTLAEILLRQNKFMEAEAITVHADRGAGGLCYDSALGCKAVPSEALDNASSQGLAEVRDFKARLHLKMYQSGTSPASLDIAEKNARRAFQLRRDSSDTDNPKFKSIVDLLVRIYHMHPEKKMYAEIYRELYPTDQGRQGSIALSHHTTTTSASGPALNISSVIYSIKEHKDDDEQDVLHLIEESILHDVELNALVNGKSAMMVAVDCDDCARCDNIIDKLLRSGASGELPLQYAVRNLKSAKCTRLFEFNVDINCLDMHNMTPLMNAIKRDHKDMVSFLIENNADLNVSGPGGCTALHMAIKRWNAGIVRLLLDKKDRITLNSQDNEGWTALHYCAKFDKPLLAKKLYRDGADLEVEDNSDMKRTALWFAIDLQRYRITEILLELGAKINPSCMSLSTSNDIRNLLRTKRFGNG
jgi:hypothetical protein